MISAIRAEWHRTSAEFSASRSPCWILPFRVGDVETVSAKQFLDELIEWLEANI
jgi:hypothetical protein